MGGTSVPSAHCRSSPLCWASALCAVRKCCTPPTVRGTARERAVDDSAVAAHGLSPGKLSSAVSSAGTCSSLLGGLALFGAVEATGGPRDALIKAELPPRPWVSGGIFVFPAPWFPPDSALPIPRGPAVSATS